MPAWACFTHSLKVLSAVTPRVRVISGAFDRPGSLRTTTCRGPFSFSSTTSCSIVRVTSLIALTWTPSSSRPNE